MVAVWVGSFDGCTALVDVWVGSYVCVAVLLDCLVVGGQTGVHDGECVQLLVLVQCRCVGESADVIVFVGCCRGSASSRNTGSWSPGPTRTMYHPLPLAIRSSSPLLLFSLAPLRSCSVLQCLSFASPSCTLCFPCLVFPLTFLGNGHSHHLHISLSSACIVVD